MKTRFLIKALSPLFCLMLGVTVMNSDGFTDTGILRV